MMKGKLRGGVGIWERKKNRPQNPWSLRFAATRWWALHVPTRTAQTHISHWTSWRRLVVRPKSIVGSVGKLRRNQKYAVWNRRNNKQAANADQNKSPWMFPYIMERNGSHTLTLDTESCYFFTWLGKVSQSCKLLPYRNYEEPLTHYTLGWNVPTCFRISSYPQFM